MRLPDEGNIDDVVHRLDQLHLCAGLFQCFAQRTLRKALAAFHKARRQRPKAIARLNRATAQQYFALKYRNRADDHFRIVVMHETTARTHRTHARIVVGDAVFDGAAALRTKSGGGRERGGRGRGIVGTHGRRGPIF